MQDFTNLLKLLPVFVILSKFVSVCLGEPCAVCLFLFVVSGVVIAAAGMFGLYISTDLHHFSNGY